MQHGPGHVQHMAGGKVHAVEQVVPRHQHHTQHDQRPARQPHQRRQRQHRQPDHPDHLQEHGGRRELEGPGKVDDRDLQQHEEQAPLPQERGRRRAAVRLLRAVEKGRQPGQEHEHRRAQVRQQAAEEQRRRRLRHQHRVGHLVVQVEGLAHVVQQHEQDHEAAQRVDGEQPGRGTGPGWQGSR
ncbi:hypothetical protein D3C72_1527610 [compost metagenome]